jgi:hypothetical protein
MKDLSKFYICLIVHILAVWDNVLDRKTIRKYMEEKMVHMNYEMVKN